MNKKTIPLEYANNLIYELEKSFWDERGKGARFRVTTVGYKYFQEKCLSAIQSPDLDHILQTIGSILESEGIVGKVSYSQEDRLFRVRIERCLHRPVEDEMIARGIEPFTCVPANLMVLAIEEKLDRPVELAEVKVEDGACQILLVVFEHRPTLG